MSTQSGGAIWRLIIRPWNRGARCSRKHSMECEADQSLTCGSRFEVIIKSTYCKWGARNFIHYGRTQTDVSDTACTGQASRVVSQQHEVTVAHQADGWAKASSIALHNNSKYCAPRTISLNILWTIWARCRRVVIRFPYFALDNEILNGELMVVYGITPTFHMDVSKPHKISKLTL